MTSDQPGRSPWPPGDGEMAERVRRFDWATTPLGPIEGWPASLKVAVQLVLAQDNPTNLVLWPSGTMIYNDACAAMIGAKHPRAFGRNAHETFAEVEFDGYLRHAMAGETVALADVSMPFMRHGAMEQAWFDVSYSPVRDEEGTAFAILVSIRETTARVLAEKARSEHEAQQAFLLELSDAMRLLADPVEVQGVAMRLLGRYLNVDRAIYFAAEQGEAGWLHVVESDYHRTPDMPSLIGRHPIAAFGAELLGGMPQGAHVVVGDVRALPPRITDREVQRYLALGIVSMAVTPILKGDLYLGGVSLLHASPRTWTEGEVALIRDVAERTWSAVERAHAEKAMRESEFRYRGLLSASNEVLYRHDPTWSHMRQLRGGGFLADTESPDPNWFDRYIPAEDQRYVWERIQEAIRTRSVFELEHRVIRADGTVGWTLSRSTPVFDANGEIVEWFGAASDVTARREAVQALRESEARFRQFAAASSGALWIRDAATLEMEYASPAIAHIYGVEPDAFLGDIRRWAAAIVPEDRDVALEHIEQARSGRAVVHEFRIQRASDGAFRWIRNTDFPLFDEHGRVQRVGGIAEDVTGAKLATEHQAVLLAELQHRVRNIMAIIRSIAARTGKSATSVKDYADAMTGRLKALARVQALLTRGANVGVDLARIAGSEIAAQAHHAAQYTVMGPEVVLPPKAVEVMTMALHELATNALKYGALSSDAGHIDVAWRLVDKQGERWLSFDWTERGAPPALPIDAAVPRRRGFGTELIEGLLPYELGGEAQVEMAAGGARCHLEFPLKAGASILETDAPKRATVCGGSLETIGPVDLGGHRVLVIEDEYYLAADAARALRVAGAEVLGPCRTEDDALDQVAHGDPTGALVDINLGPGPSFKLAGVLKQAGIPFIFMTGYDEEAIPPELASVPRLQKPVGLKQIVTALAEALSNG